MKTIPIILLLALTAFAVEPNYVRTTVYKVGKVGTDDKDLVSTSYSDGLGRQLQSKLKIDGTHDRVSCTFYDEAGRPAFSTKAFVDNLNPGSFLDKSLIELNDAATGLLRKQAQYNNDANPYSYTLYSDDPLGRVVEQNGPGEAYTNYPVKMFYFGIPKLTGTFSVGSINITFSEGIITSAITDDVLDKLTNNPLANADHFLTITRTVVKDPPPATSTHLVFTQELKDLFGKTVVTKSKPSTTQNIISKYSYDILGNLTAETAPKPSGAEIDDTKYSYNTLGQLVNKSTPDGGTFGYAYTLTGQLEYDTSYSWNNPPTAKTIYRIRKYDYDDFDRLIWTKLKANPNEITSDGWNTVALNFYDDIDALSPKYASMYNIPQWLPSSLQNLTGRLVVSVAMGKINGITYCVSDLFSYDDEGRIDKKYKIVPGMPVQTISYTYDLHGKALTETTECGAEKITKRYDYDAEGRLEKNVHVDNANKTLATYAYDNLGRMNKKTLGIGGGYPTQFAYEIRDRIKSITSLGINRVDESAITYNANGNITFAWFYYNHPGINENATAANFDYSYDDVNRLTSVKPAGVESTHGVSFRADYKYDALGRFNEKIEGADSKTGYTYYIATNRLKNTDGSGNDYLYDKHGNMVVDLNKKMVTEYDWRDMPVAFRFYNAIPSAITAETDGLVKVSDTETDLYKYMTKMVNEVTPTTTLLSQVFMLYDASGNRVLKMEGK